MEFEEPEDNTVQIDISDSQKRRVGRPRKIKRTVDDQGNQLTQVNGESNTTNELHNLTQSRGNSLSPNTIMQPVTNGPKQQMTIG